MSSRFGRGLLQKIPSLALVSLLIFIWEGTARRGIYSPHLFPPPSAIFPALLGMIKSGQLWIDFKASGERWIAGYCLGAILGIFAGLALGRSMPVRLTFAPLVNGFSSIPKVMLIPLAILWFGIGEQEKILLVAWGTFFPVWLTVQCGVERLEPEMLWAGRSLGMSKVALIREVILPGILPYLISGLRMGLSTATFALAAAEMAGAFTGLAHRVFYDHEMFETNEMMAGIVVISILSWLANLTFVRVSHWLAPWIEEEARL